MDGRHRLRSLLVVLCMAGLVLSLCEVATFAQDEKKRFEDIKAKCEQLLKNRGVSGQNSSDLTGLIRELGKIKIDSCVDYLSGLFGRVGEKSYNVKIDIVRALAGTGTGRAVKKLAKIAVASQDIIKPPDDKRRTPGPFGGPMGPLGAARSKANLAKAIIKALMDVVSEDTLHAVCAEIKKSNLGSVRKYFVIAIGEKKLEGAFDTLKDLLKDSSSGFMAEVMIAIAKIASYPEKAADILAPKAQSGKWEVRAVAMDALALLPCNQSVKACIACLGDKVWQVRAAAVQALARLYNRESIEPLIDALEKESNERLIGDIVDALRYLSGVNYECDAKLWRKWWEAVKEDFRTPDEEKKDDGEIGKDGPATGLPEPPPPPPRPRYNGMELKSFRVIFIIDRSGSMTGQMTTTIGGKQVSGTKHEIAIKELTKVINQMDKRYWFNVIFYNQAFEVWQKKLTRATDKARKAAIKWINSVKPEGSTNIGDALEEAFKDKKADTIYLLSDGRANTGKYPDPGSIISAVKGWFRKRRIKINTISFGSDADPQFMEELARMTGGKHVKK